MKRAFTLIELLVALGLLGIMSAVLLSFIGQGPQRSARDARRMADIQRIASALELFRADRGGYPQSCAGGACLQPQYLNTVPSDPVPANGSYAYTSRGTCNASGVCTGYELCANLERTPALTCPNDHVVNNP